MRFMLYTRERNIKSNIMQFEYNLFSQNIYYYYHHFLCDILFYYFAMP